MTHTLSRPPNLLESHYSSDRGACGFVLTAYTDRTQDFGVMSGLATTLTEKLIKK